MKSNLPGTRPTLTTAGDPQSSSSRRLLETYTMQQAATLTGLSEHTLRYYERIGLINPVARQETSGHRRYGPAALTKLETLACLRAAGMPIEQMRRYFELRSEGDSSAAELQALLSTHLDELQRRRTELQGHMKYVERKIDYWSAVEAHDGETAAQIAREVDQMVRATFASGG